MTSTDQHDLDSRPSDLRTQPSTPEETPEVPEEALEERPGTYEEQQQRSLTPRQARRIRIWVAAIFMAGAAVALVVRLSEQPSVLIMGVYGAALILCGTVIELSRRGRTRIGMWLLVIGLVAVAVADQLLRAR